MRKEYKAFTLVEMLIVMGIIIILMAVGITAGRFAINRANDVAHQNAVDNFYTAVQAYYTDNREFPVIADFDEALTAPEEMDTYDYIGEYMEEGAFDGGTDATYYYEIDQLQQEVLICVSLFGLWDSGRDGEYYCNGNGFGSENLLGGAITEKIIPNSDGADFSPLGEGFDAYQNWADNAWGTAGTGVPGS
jgi:type II secretory pathway pseudopilin PulG